MATNINSLSAEELVAFLKQLISDFRQLIGSPDVEDVNIDDEMRPTFTKWLTLLMQGGVRIFESAEAGLEETVFDEFFGVVSEDESLISVLYQNVEGVAVPRKNIFSAKAYFDVYEKLIPSGIIDDVWRWAVADKDGYPLLGVRSDGFAEGLFDKLPGTRIISDYAWAITDKDGFVLYGIKWTGEVVTYGHSGEEGIVYETGPAGSRDIYILISGEPYQITSDGDNSSPTASLGVVSYMRRNNRVSRETAAYPEEGSIADFVEKIYHLLCSGQSLAMGVASSVTTTQSPTANRLLTLANGVRLANQDDTLTAEMVAPFQPLIAKTQESPCVQMTAQLNRLRALPANSGTLTSLHGRGGYRIDQLNKGTQYYNNSITAVTESKSECDDLGYDYEVPFVDWIQGEDNRSDGPGEYYDGMVELQNDYQNDIQAISGQTSNVPILLDQISNWTSYGLTESNVPLDQFQLALDMPERFVCAGPKYWVETTPSDGTHLIAPSSMRVGCMHARAAEAIINGYRWLPTHCIRAVRNGTKVTLDFHTPYGALTIDTVRVSDPGNYGIRWIDDASSATVESVALVGGNRVEVTLSAEPTGSSPMIGIADVGEPDADGGPFTGPRACLRDSSQDVDSYGYPIYNWTCHQRIAVN